MKSKYFLATLVGFFMSNTTVTASACDSSDDENGYVDRIGAIATAFEDLYYRSQAKKEKKRVYAQSELTTAERNAAIAALEAESASKEKKVEFPETKLASPTSPKTPASKVEEAKTVPPKKTEISQSSE